MGKSAICEACHSIILGTPVTGNFNVLHSCGKSNERPAIELIYEKVNSKDRLSVTVEECRYLKAYERSHYLDRIHILFLDFARKNGRKPTHILIHFYDYTIVEKLIYEDYGFQAYVNASGPPKMQFRGMEFIRTYDVKKDEIIVL